MSLPPARVIVEQSADGSMILECYKNGSRLRLPLTQGFEMIEIKAELASLSQGIKAEAERKALREVEAAKRLHERVWWQTSANFGQAFANRTIGTLQSKTVPPKYKGAPAIVGSIDLIGPPL